MSDRKLNIKQERYTNLNTDIRGLFYKFQKVEEEMELFEEGTKFICGLPLPDFQRSSVWKNSQRVSFLESVFYGYDLGSYVVATWEMKNDKLLPYSDCLIDGQQRLESLELFWRNELEVFGYQWHQLGKLDRSQFLSAIIGKRIIETIDPEVLKATYNRLNFAGTAHKESERA